METLLDLSALHVWLGVGALWLVLMITNIRIGWTATREARASVWSLLWTAAVLALFVVLPAGIFAIFITFSIASDATLRIALGSVFFCILTTARYLSPPVRLLGTSDKLPPVTDEALLERVASIAAAMQVRMPLIRVWPSVSGTQQTLAYVGTLQAPQIVITDGILRRLEPAERDAIIAHELAHLANRSIWMLAAVFPISCTVMTAVTDRLPGPLALLFGMAFFVGLKRIVSRPIELNCDYLAARAVGFRATSSALAKIHAVHPISNSGLLALLLYATASHPSRDARLAALHDASPAEDRPTHGVNLPMVQTSGRVAYGALIVWILVLTATFVLAGRDRVEPWLAALLLITACSPFALLLMGIRKQVRRQSRRMGRRWGLLSKVIGGTIGGSVAILLFTMIGVTVANRFEIEVVDPTVVIAVVSCAVVLVSMMINLVNGAQRKLQQAVNVALQLHDFARARELCLASPQIVSKSHMLRYQLAIADAVCGNRQAAMESLEQLWQDKPHFPLPALALAELQLDANEAERTVELARTVERLLPHDTTVALLEGRALRRLGLTEESQITCHTAQAMEPEDGSLRALAAGLELDLGQFDQSRQLIEQALEQVPGDAYALVIRAEIEIATAPLESAQQAVSEAIDAIHTNPLIFLQFEVNRLQTLLAAAENRQTVPPNR